MENKKRCGQQHSIYKDLVCFELVDENGFHVRLTPCVCGVRQPEHVYFYPR